MARRPRVRVRAASAGAGTTSRCRSRGRGGGSGGCRLRQIAAGVAEIIVPRMQKGTVAGVGAFRVAWPAGRGVFQAGQKRRLTETRHVGLPVALIRRAAGLGLLEHVAVHAARGKLARWGRWHELRVILSRGHPGTQEGREGEARNEMTGQATEAGQLTGARHPGLMILFSAGEEV